MINTHPKWLFDDSEIPDEHGRGEKMVRFSRLLKHPKSDENQQGLQLTEWQERILRAVYGPSGEDGKRLVKTVFCLLPRGNRKTTLGAVMAMGHTIGPEQIRGGQVISAASDRSQARIAFDEAAEMVRLDDILNQHVKIRDTRSRIEHPKSRSVYSAISADGDAQQGKTPSFVLADELHVWKGFGLWNALKTGLSKTKNTLLVIITTAGERPEGPCWELYQYASKVASCVIDDSSFLPILFEGDPEADWTDETLWHEVNPGLKYGFPDIESLREDVRLAKQIPRMRAAFETLNLNRWQDGSVAGWVEMAIWDKGDQVVEDDKLQGRECFVAVDMSKSYDLTAVVAAFPEGDGYILRSWFWLPQDTIAKRAVSSDEPWKEWLENGDLLACPGAVIDEGMIEEHLHWLNSEFDVQEIAFDPALAGRMMARLQEEDLPVVSFQQYIQLMAPAINELQRSILDGSLIHGGHPILRWNIANVFPRVNATNLLTFSKKQSADAIDGAVAAAMAVGRASQGGEGSSIYETQERSEGLLIL